MFGKLGEIMRRKFNQKGAVLSTIAIIGVVGAVAFFGGKAIVDETNASLYGILRSLCIFIDTQVYSISAFAYSIFYEISSSSILSSLNLSDASQRLYTLLGIFMLFRLAFSFVKYIINPDGMEKGTSKLLTNLAVSLALIVSVPWIFNRAFALQNYIMDSNVIGNLIMGMNTSKDSDTFNAASYGQTVGFLTFNAFYRVDSSIPAYSSCGNLLSYYSPYVVPIEGNKVGIDPAVENSLSDAEKKEANKIASCVNALNGVESNTPEISYTNAAKAAELGTLLYIASQRQDMGILTDSSLVQAVVGNTYLIQYSVIVSTIAGCFLALLFLNFSFDVAVRNAKLCFLQLIAPIPIILNIEPGDSKGDKKSLNWWAKECLHTYALLFIRVAIVYFGVFLINVLFGSMDSSTQTNTSAWFQVFMILGILLFVKEIPDMIGKAFGIDVKGQFNLNPLKRIGDSRIASMAVGGTAGLIGGGVGSAIASGLGAARNGASRSEVVSSVLTGGVGGALRSGLTGAGKGAKSVHDITSNISQNSQRAGRIAGANVGTTLGGRLATRLTMAMGAPTSFDIMQNNAKEMDEMGMILKNIKENAYKDGNKLTSIDGNTSFMFKDSKGVAHTVDLSKAGLGISSTKDAHDYVERIKASGASESDIRLAESLEKEILSEYYSAHETDNMHYVGSMVKRYNELQSRQKGNLPSTVGVAKKVSDIAAATAKINSSVAAYKVSDAWRKAEATKNAAQANKGGR